MVAQSTQQAFEGLFPLHPESRVHRCEALGGSIVARNMQQAIIGLLFFRSRVKSPVAAGLAGRGQRMLAPL